MTYFHPSRPQVFLDLDGVMADFDGDFPDRFGFDHRDVSDAVMWKTINDYGTFFRDMSVCVGALWFFEELQDRGCAPVILTACPESDFANVAQQKRGWVRQHLGPDVPIVFTPGGKTKALYMHAPGDILIDDFERNVRRWKEAGGRPIHHLGDFSATLATLIDYLETPWNG